MLKDILSETPYEDLAALIDELTLVGASIGDDLCDSLDPEDADPAASLASAIDTILNMQEIMGDIAAYAPVLEKARDEA